jgi:DNA-binding response OmpR family regulator
MAHILLVEPDRILAKTYFAALKAAGHVVRITATAQSAVFCADDVRPDIAIIELQLASHSGIEFLYEFRSYPDWQKIPVIVNTCVPAGEFSDSWQSMRKQLTISAYHYKPLSSLRMLIQSVNELVHV